MTIEIFPNRIVGRAGCLRFSGAAEFRWPEIVIKSGIVDQEAPCDGRDMKARSASFDIWRTFQQEVLLADHYKVQGDRLELRTSSGADLRFTRSQAADE